MKNKKGSADAGLLPAKAIYYVISLILLSICIILFAGNSYSFLDSRATTPVYLEEDILISQLVNSCFVYEEQSGPLKGRIYQNVIDAHKLNNNMLDSCISGSALVTITSFDNEFEPYSLKTGTTTITETFTQLVIVKKDGQLYPAKMTVVL